jgi:hypothetical protein
LLRATGWLLIDLQKTGNRSAQDEHYLRSVIELDDRLHAQEVQGVETFYNHLVLPIKKVIEESKDHRFSNMDGLLEVARERDKSERLYQELFGSRDIYIKTLQEELAKLTEEFENLKQLKDSLII